MRIILRGHIPAKKNLLRRSRNGGLFRDKEVSEQIDTLVLQAKAQWAGKAPLDKPELTIQFVCIDQRGDLDNKLVTILDVLQQSGIIVNDNLKHLREFHIYGSTGAEETCAVWTGKQEW